MFLSLTGQEVVLECWLAKELVHMTRTGTRNGAGGATALGTVASCEVEGRSSRILGVIFVGRENLGAAGGKNCSRRGNVGRYATNGDLGGSVLKGGFGFVLEEVIW